MKNKPKLGMNFVPHMFMSLSVFVLRVSPVSSPCVDHMEEAVMIGIPKGYKLSIQKGKIVHLCDESCSLMKSFACSLPEESRKTFAMIVLTEGVSSNEKKKGSLGRLFVGGHVLQEFFP